MEIARAKEIITSGEVVHVLYHGNSVWLENVKGNDMAEVVRLDKYDRIQVPVDDLVERRNS